MQNRRYPISIQGHIFSVEEQKRFSYSSLFGAGSNSTDTLEADCLCNAGKQSGGKKSPTVLISRRIDRNGFSILRSPNTGEAHSIFCIFNSIPNIYTGLQAYDSKVVEETEDGNIKIILKKKLFPHIDNSYATKTSSDKLMCLSLRAVLDLIWTESRLNRWFPSPKCERRLGLVCAEISKAASRIYSQETPLSRNLLLHAPIGSNLEAKNSEIVNSALTNESKLLVIAPLKPSHLVRIGGKPKLPVVGNFGLKAMFLPEHVWNKTLSRFSTEIQIWEKGFNVIALARITPQQDGDFNFAKVTEVALMAVSEAWTPVSSLDDIDQEASFRSESQSYIKPLKYDYLPGNEIPAFIIASDDHYRVIKKPEID
ncbi:DUF1173 family protein [Pseudomonas sp. Irchel 3E13]|uniref:DUF1173 family protein n=1 Tax=Pseudomonas sp. Irchel 3E13 TaxID=2008975 RepID=UPI000BA414DF|nr:DUF1173 family protein [Pseudomonas sp. Irchel 3E13]